VHCQCSDQSSSSSSSCCCCRVCRLFCLPCTPLAAAGACLTAQPSNTCYKRQLQLQALLPVHLWLRSSAGACLTAQRGNSCYEHQLQLQSLSPVHLPLLLPHVRQHSGRCSAAVTACDAADLERKVSRHTCLAAAAAAGAAARGTAKQCCS
jgi:hypothetical protein